MHDAIVVHRMCTIHHLWLAEPRRQTFYDRGGGPVGSGKTALVDCLCKALRDTYHLAPW